MSSNQKKKLNRCSSTAGCGYNISCFQRIAGTLTKDEILAHNLVQRGDPKHNPKYETTTVDLTVGDGHYLFDGDATPESARRWKLIFIGDDSRMQDLNKDTSPEKYSPPPGNKPHTLIIPAYGSALVQLNETIDTYSVAHEKEKNLLIVGRFDLKLSRVHQGLISQQATQIEPCYRGKLFCFIHNLSNEQIELTWGEYLATIEFSYVSCFCDREKKLSIIEELSAKTRKKYSNKFCNGTGINDIRYFFDAERLPNDCGLVGFQKKLKDDIFSEKSIDSLVKELDKKVDKKAKWIPIITSVISLLAVVFSVVIPLRLQNTDLQDRIAKLEETVQAISATNDYPTLTGNGN